MRANSSTFSPVSTGLPKLVVLCRNEMEQQRALRSLSSLQECDVLAVPGAGDARDVKQGAWKAERELVRRWLNQRDSRRGFVLAGFPRDVADALVLDALLEAGDESLTVVLDARDPVELCEDGSDLADHYADQGLSVLSCGRLETPTNIEWLSATENLQP